MVILDARIDTMGGFPDSKMIDTNNSNIKNHTYRLINALQTRPMLIFLNLCLLGLKFGMARLDTGIDSVQGFLDSGMTNTNNSSIKNIPID